VLDLHDDEGVRLSGLVAETERLVAAGRDEIRARGRVLPGVREALEALATPGTVQTVLTGNTAANAAVKLDGLGLADRLDLDVGAYGSDDHDRNNLVPVALDRIARRYGPLPGADRTWVVGDTPLDAAGADHVVDDLTDTAALVGLLGTA